MQVIALLRRRARRRAHNPAASRKLSRRGHSRNASEDVDDDLSLMRAERTADAPAGEFHARVDALLPLIEQRADEAERLGHMTDDVVDALRKSGIYTMLFPKAVGGPEISPFDAMQIVERLSYAHASAGWCTIVNNMEGMTMAIYIEDPASPKSSAMVWTLLLPATACRVVLPGRSTAAT